MPNLQNHHYFELDFQNVNQHQWGKWLIQRKENQLQRLELPQSQSHDLTLSET